MPRQVAFVHSVTLIKSDKIASSAWLQPAFRAFSIEADLDKIDALAGEREIEWRRIGAAGFLSDDEKREALGYNDRRRRKTSDYEFSGDSLGDVSDSAPEGADGGEHWRIQPRVPAGNADGGQWTDRGIGDYLNMVAEGPYSPRRSSPVTPAAVSCEDL